MTTNDTGRLAPDTTAGGIGSNNDATTEGSA
jgi:hypothetical protein